MATPMDSAPRLAVYELIRVSDGAESIFSIRVSIVSRDTPRRRVVRRVPR